MLRYSFILIPLSIGLFIAILNYNEINTDYNIPSFLCSTGMYGLLRFKRLSTFQKYLAFYIGLALSNEVFAFHSYFWFDTNFPVYHIYSWVQVMSFGLIFSTTLNLGRYANYYWLIVFSIVAVDISNCIFLGTLEEFPSLNVTLLGSFILPLTLFQFKQMIHSPIEEKLIKQPVFWFNFGTFLFVALTFFMFGFLSTTTDLPDWMYLILEGANIFLYATYFIAIILDSPPKTTKNDSIN